MPAVGIATQPKRCAARSPRRAIRGTSRFSTRRNCSTRSTYCGALPAYEFRRPTTRFCAAAGRDLRSQLLRILQATIRLYHRPIVKAFAGYWAEHPADLVLSVIPHFNRELAESLRLQGGVPKPAVRHADYRPGRLPAALLDRARVGIHYRGHRTSPAAGLGDGPCRRPCLRDFWHGFEAEVL